jgi:NAD(P)-dependent dehydrogenase (short-subunit alcohol dehydrogenase family)
MHSILIPQLHQQPPHSSEQPDHVAALRAGRRNQELGRRTDRGMAVAGNIEGKRVCLLTGASGTLGTEFCRLYRNRYQIAAVYANHFPTVPSQCGSWIDPLNPRSSTPDQDSVFTIKADLFKEGQITRVIELTLARFGRIDLLVNAAVHSRWASAIETNELVDSALRQFEMNVVVPLKLSVAIAHEFWRDRGPENSAYNRNIVNVSSSAGVYVYRNPKQSIYSGSKAALNFLSCHLAEEFKSFGIRVNAIAPNAFPGVITTQCVAESIQRLDTDTVTGQILIVDSGGELLYRPD